MKVNVTTAAVTVRLNKVECTIQKTCHNDTWVHWSPFIWGKISDISTLLLSSNY